MPEWVVIRTFSYQHEAEVVRSVLEGSGIEAITNSDDCGALDPALGLVRGVNVLVADDQLEQAENVLGAPRADQSPDPSPAD